MQLVYFLILPSALLSTQLLGFATREASVSGAASPVVDWRVWLNMWFVVGCFALTARWLEKSQQHSFNIDVEFNGRAKALSPVWMLRNRESLLLWLWCVLQPICLVSSGWTQWTQRLTGASGSQACSIAILLTPCFVLLLLIEMIRCSRAIRNRRIGPSTGLSLRHYRREMTRMVANTWLFPLALPIVIAGLVDLGALSRVDGSEQGLLGTVLCTITTSAIVTILIPHLFTRLIGAGPIEEPIALAVERTWRMGSTNVPRVLHWPTGCRMANAAVVGLFGYGRKLLLTDALLQRLTDRELSMVVLHELAHCVRLHAWIRMVPTLLAVTLLLVAMNLLAGLWLSLSCVAILGLFVACLIATCWWTEFDADRCAIEFAVRSGNDLGRDTLLPVYASELCQALSKIYGSRNMERSSWMHPSCSQRIAAIRLLV